MQSVMTRTATPRAPSGSMTDVFACTRAQIYYNSKRKPLAQVKRESGCSHIINGYLFNGSFQPVGWTVIDGKVISRDIYQDWGISIGSDGKPQMLTDRGGSFLSGVVDVDATIYCEKASHKGIIIGKQGAMLKKISSLARADMEKFMGTKVYLQTWVKVKENWRDNLNYVRSMGYRDE